MTTLTISEARENLADLGNRVALRGERIVIARRGRDLCALVPVEDLELLERLEDAMDLETIRERLDEPTKSLARVKKELGL
jgi:prevent-host-death family protein